ncbi:glutamate racemase [Malikia granosa]|uniref:Glutamate racemase n=1 Tax=Malikia granosa TaxID=263067 RepID=A0A2S9K4U1_9BURK|nr:glutamate racemase [Malikia granosa]PRD65486.1 glutamate racemase [Malikia granosa]
MPAPAATEQDRSRPIGVFDSGVGGLSVLREIRRALPAETLCYVADSAHAPYGERSVAYIEARSRHIIGFLQAQGAKAVVVACNTVTGLVIGHLRAAFPGLPLIAIEPAVKPAAQSTHSGVIGLLATRQTVASPGLQRLLQLHASGRQVLLQACPGWVERVERGELDGAETEAAVAQFLRPLLAQGADTLVLGCTHYPFLAPLIRRLAGPAVQVLDPAPAVARELARRLAALDLLNPATEVGREQFWTSADPRRIGPVISALWGAPVEPALLPAALPATAAT